MKTILIKVYSYMSLVLQIKLTINGYIYICIHWCRKWNVTIWFSKDLKIFFPEYFIIFKLVKQIKTANKQIGLHRATSLCVKKGIFLGLSHVTPLTARAHMCFLSEIWGVSPLRFGKVNKRPNSNWMVNYWIIQPAKHNKHWDLGLLIGLEIIIICKGHL